MAMKGSPGVAALGVVAGRKVGSAVRRNRAKRRLREAAAKSHLKRDTVYVLIADRGVLNAPFDRLIGWIDGCAEALSTASGDER